MFTFGISRASHLLLICTGIPAFHDLMALVDLAAVLCRRERWSRILVDCVSVPPTFSPVDLEHIGQYAGKALVGKHVAIVVPDEKRFQATRAAAAGAGGKLRFFTNHVDAADWLATSSRSSAAQELHGQRIAFTGEEAVQALTEDGPGRSHCVEER